MIDSDFECQLDENPSDWALRLVYSDWLEEHENLKLAEVQRWMTKNERCPFHYHDLDDWNAWIIGWHCGYDQWSKHHAPNAVQLKVDLFQKLKPCTVNRGNKVHWRFYVTRQEAEAALADVLCLNESQSKTSSVTGT